jgi:cation/acetate symporter
MFLAALVAAGAFAAFLSTSSGLLVSVAGALSHDIMRGGVGTFRLCAVLAGAVATLAALPVDRFSLGLLVGWAFAIAASSFCPLIVLGIWWRRLTWIGAPRPASSSEVVPASARSWRPCSVPPRAAGVPRCSGSPPSGRCRSRSSS